MGAAQGAAVGCAASPLLGLLELNNVAFWIPAVEHGVASKAPSSLYRLEITTCGLGGLADRGQAGYDEAWFEGSFVSGLRWL